MHRFANPARFQRIANVLLPWVASAAALGLAIGLVWGLVFAPADYQQGDSVRIIYIHVPAAWMALFVYVVIAAASGVALIWKHPLAHLAARAASPVGASFAFLTLVTGSLWGKPMWGTWWEWDGRLTSMLVLFFLYLGHMALMNAFENRERGYQAAAILAVVGVINIPIIKFSVDWWATLHQPASVFRADGPTIDAAMLWPLLISALGFKFYFVTLLFWGIKRELVAAKARALEAASLRGA